MIPTYQRECSFTTYYWSIGMGWTLHHVSLPLHWGYKKTTRTREEELVLLLVRPPLRCSCYLHFTAEGVMSVAVVHAATHERGRSSLILAVEVWWCETRSIHQIHSASTSGRVFWGQFNQREEPHRKETKKDHSLHMPHTKPRYLLYLFTKTRIHTKRPQHSVINSVSTKQWGSTLVLESIFTVR